MKAREFYLDLAKQTHGDGFEGDVYGTKLHDCFVHVREVLPDTVTITREELRAALQRCNDSESEFLLFQTEMDMIVREVFASTASSPGGES